MDLAERAWNAFTAPDPRKIIELLETDTIELPFSAAVQGTISKRLIITSANAI